MPLAYGVDIAVEVDSLFEEAATVDDVTQEAAAAADVTPRVEPVLFALPYSIFGEPLRVDILHQAVKWQRANARAARRRRATLSWLPYVFVNTGHGRLI